MERVYLAGSYTARFFVAIWEMMYRWWRGDSFPRHEIRPQANPGLATSRMVDPWIPHHLVPIDPICLVILRSQRE